MEIHIQHDEAHWKVNIYAFEREPGAKVFYHISETGSLIPQHVPEGELPTVGVINPLLSLPRDMYLDLMKALVLEFKKAFGEKEVEAKYEGELKGKDEHIKDLRLTARELTSALKMMIKVLGPLPMVETVKKVDV